MKLPQQHCFLLIADAASARFSSTGLTVAMAPCARLFAVSSSKNRSHLLALVQLIDFGPHIAPNLETGEVLDLPPRQ